MFQKVKNAAKTMLLSDLLICCFYDKSITTQFSPIVMKGSIPYVTRNKCLLPSVDFISSIDYTVHLLYVKHVLCTKQYKVKHCFIACI